MAASLVVWLCKLKWFGGDGFVSFDERLSAAYSHFREFCHTTKRFTACDHWSAKKFSMASILGWFLLITFCSKIVLFIHWFFTAKISIYRQHLPSSLASKEQWLPYQHCWERSRYCSCLQVAWISLCWGWYLAPIPSKKNLRHLSIVDIASFQPTTSFEQLRIAIANSWKSWDTPFAVSMWSLAFFMIMESSFPVQLVSEPNKLDLMFVSFDFINSVCLDMLFSLHGGPH